jgi:hypothetical protein
MPEDRIEREIEDILSRLDSFIPEESVASRMRHRASDAAAAFTRAVVAPLARISIRQVMLAALVLIVVGFIAGRALPYGKWVLIAGVILLVTSFALSFVNRGAGSAPPYTEKRWRGRPLDLQGPTFGDRLRSWFQSKRRPPY